MFSLNQPLVYRRQNASKRSRNLTITTEGTTIIIMLAIATFFFALTARTWFNRGQNTAMMNYSSNKAHEFCNYAYENDSEFKDWEFYDSTFEECKSEYTKRIYNNLTK